MVRDFQYVAIGVRVSFAIILFVALVTVARKHKSLSRIFEDTYRRHGVYLRCAFQISAVPLFLRQTIKSEGVILSPYFVFSDIERDIAIRLRQRCNEEFRISICVNRIVIGELFEFACVKTIYGNDFLLISTLLPSFGLIFGI